MYNPYLSIGTLQSNKSDLLVSYLIRDGYQNIKNAYAKKIITNITLENLNPFISIESFLSNWRFRIKHLLAGMSLIPPVINRVALYILREKVSCKLSNKDMLLGHPLHAEIETFVSKFLFMYIKGEVKPMTECPRRPSLTQMLFQRLASLKDIYSHEIDSIIETAFYFYLKVSVTGLYMYLRKIKKIGDDDYVTIGSEGFKMLLAALEPALKKDFPSLVFSTESVAAYAEKSLNEFNEEQKRFIRECG